MVLIEYKHAATKGWGGTDGSHLVVHCSLPAKSYLSTKHPRAHATPRTSRSSMLQLRRRALNWRAWRVASTGSGIGGKQHLVPQHLRLLGTGTSRTTSGGSAERTTSSNVLALALGGVVLGLGGYYIGAHSNHHTPVESPGSPSKPVYGTPEDFVRAIQELKTLFSEETVTTAEDQLEAHGFSPSVYHLGE